MHLAAYCDVLHAWKLEWQVLIDADTFKSPAQWSVREQYGAVLSSRLYGDDYTASAVVALSEVQRACAALAFPAGLIQSVFVQWHQQDVIESSGFFAWRNDHGLTLAVPGKAAAVEQLAK